MRIDPIGFENWGCKAELGEDWQCCILMCENRNGGHQTPGTQSEVFAGGGRMGR